MNAVSAKHGSSARNPLARGLQETRSHEAYVFGHLDQLPLPAFQNPLFDQHMICSEANCSDRDQVKTALAGPSSRTASTVMIDRPLCVHHVARRSPLCSLATSFQSSPLIEITAPLAYTT